MFNKAFENHEEKIKIDNYMKYCGFFILISKSPIDKNDILPAYYDRQSIEQIFGLTKCNDTLPLQAH